MFTCFFRVPRSRVSIICKDEVLYSPGCPWNCWLRCYPRAIRPFAPESGALVGFSLRLRMILLERVRRHEVIIKLSFNYVSGVRHDLGDRSAAVPITRAEEGKAKAQLDRIPRYEDFSGSGKIQMVIRVRRRFARVQPARHVAQFPCVSAQRVMPIIALWAISISGRSSHVRQKLVDQPRQGHEPIRLFASCIMSMIALSRLIVIAHQHSPGRPQNRRYLYPWGRSRVVW